MRVRGGADCVCHSSGGASALVGRNQRRFHAPHGPWEAAPDAEGARGNHRVCTFAAACPGLRGSRGVGVRPQLERLRNAKSVEMSNIEYVFRQDVQTSLPNSIGTSRQVATCTQYRLKAFSLGVMCSEHNLTTALPSYLNTTNISNHQFFHHEL